ncbi:hypothetical protein CGC21_23585 [Leishmania donovani]|nr:hypothetical protein CGC21_23585 [Leishmania donovani]
MPLFTGFNFNTASFQKCVPEKTGDGGICIGHLIFRKDMEVLASKLIDEIREDQSWLRESGYFSVGGPCDGQNATGAGMLAVVNQRPMNLDNYMRMPDMPGLLVYNGGALDAYTPAMVGYDVFKADALFFSATASMPQIHAYRTTLLRRAKGCDAVNMVGAVLALLDHKRNPGKR